MKKLISALMLIAILLTLSACGGNVQAGPPDNGVAQTGETESIWLITKIDHYSEDGLCWGTDGYTYNDKGIMTKYTYIEFDEGGDEIYREEETYDDYGNITAYFEVDEGEQYSEKNVNEYTDGNLTKVTYYEEGEMVGYNTYTYKDGKLIEEAYYDENGILYRKETYDDMGNDIERVYYTDGEISQMDTSNNEYVDGKLVKSTHYSFGTPDGYTTYTYDDNGKLIESAYFSDNSLLGKNTYTYDDNGNLIEHVEMIGPDVTFCYTYTYNEANQLIKEYDPLMQRTRVYSYSDDGGLIGCTITDHEDGGSYRWEITSVKKAVPVSKAEELKEQQKDLLD